MSHLRALGAAVILTAAAVPQTRWTELHPGTPIPRFGPALAFDAARGVLVLASAQFATLGHYGLGDTWERGDTGWRQRLPATALPTGELRAVYDDRRQRVVVVRTPNSPGTEVWEWDGADWLRRSVVPSPWAGTDPAVCFDAARGVVLMFGGVRLDDTWEWDGTRWTQRFPNTIPPQRTAAAIAFDRARGRAVLFGGRGTSATLGDTWEFDGNDWQRRTPANAPPPLVGAMMAHDPVRGRTVLYGGREAAGNAHPGTWEWDGTDWTRRTPAHTPGDRDGHAMAFDARLGAVVLFGGDSALWTSTPPATAGTLWTWDGTDWTEIGLDAPLPRQGFAHAWDRARGRLVLFGGSDLSAYGILGGSWEWDGARWHARPSPTQPDDRQFAAMAFDEARGVSILFGGRQPRNDTWQWDGTDWQELAPATVPGDRFRHAMTYDAARRRIVMFGGNGMWPSLPVDLDDTWEWDGSDWAERQPAQRPPPRRATAIAFDRRRQVVVLFGGMHGLAPERYHGDTWEWNGTDWTDRTPAAGPRPRAEHVLVYDEDRERVVLHGGSDSTIGLIGAMDDTWEWDGAAWTQRVTPTDAGRRRGHGAAYDPARRSVTMVCGELVNANGAWLQSDVLEYAPAVRGAAEPIGTGCPGTPGVPAIAAVGPPILGNAGLQIDVGNARANAPFAVWIATSFGNVPWVGGCTLYALPPMAELLGSTSAAGAGSVALPIPFDPALRGAAIPVQGFVLDPGGAFFGLAAFTAGIRLTLGD